MASSGQGLDISSFIQAGWERNAYIACATLVTYEFFLQFDSEVEFFWKQRWSIAKCLFLWSRYYSLAFNISNAVVFLQPKPSLDVTVRPLVPVIVTFIDINPPHDTISCSKFFHWQNTGASLQVITTHLILELRLYAMYGSTRKILLLLVCLIFGEALAMGLVFGIPNPKLIGTNEPFPGNFICADADPLDGTHWVVYYWASILIIEGTLLCLALRKAWQHRPTVRGSYLMRELTRDSVIYFFAIFWIYLANLVIWYKNRITLDEFGTPFSFVISCVFANRLLIAVRSSHFRGITDVDTYLPSIHFKMRYPVVINDGSETLNNSVQLQTYNERAGV